MTYRFPQVMPGNEALNSGKGTWEQGLLRMPKGK